MKLILGGAALVAAFTLGGCGADTSTPATPSTTAKATSAMDLAWIETEIRRSANEYMRKEAENAGSDATGEVTDVTCVAQSGTRAECLQDWRETYDGETTKWRGRYLVTWDVKTGEALWHPVGDDVEMP